MLMQGLPQIDEYGSVCGVVFCRKELAAQFANLIFSSTIVGHRIW
jgi:hypothetical protein